MEQNTNTLVPVVPKAKMPIIDAGKYIKQKYFKLLMVWLLIAIILAVLFALVIPPLMIFPLFAMLVVYGVIRQKAEDAFFEQFALANNFSFQKKGLPLDFNGSLCFVGHSQIGRDLVSGEFQDIPFALLNYQYTVGSGKNSHTYIYTAFRLDFPSSLPPIFLKPKYCYFGGSMFGNISDEAKQKLNLEGNFNDYFDLWTKHDYEIETLQLFTPDFMQKIQDTWNKFSIEFKDNQIYVYHGHMITKDEELESMYQLIQYLVNKITLFAKAVKGDIEAMNAEYKN